MDRDTKIAAAGPRERVMELGVQALSNAELVTLLLGTGQRDVPASVVAENLLAELGGLRGLERAGLGELAAHAGVGPVKAARLAAAVELGARVRAAVPSEPTRPSFADSRAVASWAAEGLTRLDHEELWLLALDGKNRLRAARRVAAGGLHGLHVGARDPLRVALREGASSFVLVHNHPSGDPTPSREDEAFTRRIASAADIVGIAMLDHVVVAYGGHTSMLDAGLLEERAVSAPKRRTRS